MNNMLDLHKLSINESWGSGIPKMKKNEYKYTVN